MFILVLLAGCAGSPSLSTRDVEVDTSYTGGAVEKTLILALMADELHDSRVIIERGFTNTMKSAGMNVVAGYAMFDSMDSLLANSSGFEGELARAGIDTVLFIDPVRLDTDYDPGDYARRRSAYRALGWDDSAGINALAHLARDASAAKVVMNVELWQAENDNELFYSTYDINAPGNYDTSNARKYANQFAAAVIADLRKHGFVN